MSLPHLHLLLSQACVHLLPSCILSATRKLDLELFDDQKKPPPNSTRRLSCALRKQGGRDVLVKINRTLRFICSLLFAEWLVLCVIFYYCLFLKFSKKYTILNLKLLHLTMPVFPFLTENSF